MYSLGLYPLLDRPSRITNHSSTLIDNIFTNAKEYNNVGGLLVNDITDHLPIFAFCDYPDLKRQEKKLHTKKRIINKNTVDLLADNLPEVDWDNVLNLSEVDLAYNAFLSTFVHLYNQCCCLAWETIFSQDCPISSAVNEHLSPGMVKTRERVVVRIKCSECAKRSYIYNGKAKMKLGSVGEV